jgi:hypothetical protein
MFTQLLTLTLKMNTFIIKINLNFINILFNIFIAYQLQMLSYF